MKTRESGMPDESLWASFFEPAAILAKLGLRPEHRHVVDLGCGYGTFCVPAAQIVRGTVYAFDIEPAMIEATQAKAEAAGVTNLQVHQRDFIDEGLGLPDAEIDCVLLFNLLHAEQRATLLAEARRVLAPGGTLAIMHWNYDESTPRGPSMPIRPRPEQCCGWVIKAGFRLLPPGKIDLPPYHYGYAFTR